ncbi:hypothetical protein DBT_0077 [Dissulfuribacter thermophilus]|uniref:IPT/TIG domain-containing protein n=1 Tax=Dissulfuribacter thermophilus TaxID=1156395 RepID=A0A1B9F8M7_9BACT|nr:IPT/TIG domain-containing protein [Dissulfuribacter thermophilus]OCC16260.1 hypothetical protein DBT_0077 [Dissulfuribacter thermophilus]
MVKKIIASIFFTALTSLLTIVPNGNCGNIVSITPEKAVYVNPEPIYLLLDLTGLENGYPVDVSISLEFPDGTLAYLGPDAQFSKNNPLFIVENWPFSSVKIDSGSWSIMLPPDLNFIPGVYVIRTFIYDAQSKVLIDKSESSFTLVDAPYVDHVSPSKGITGDVVFISGQGFGTDQDLVKVFIGGREATIIEITDSSIKTWVPYGATTGVVQVTVDGIASNQVPFQVGPYIESLSSTILSPGDSLTIKGFNFDPDKNKNIVVFNGVRGTVTSAKETQLSVLVPEGNTGPLTVTANDMTSSPVEVTITPVIESIDPPRGSAGDVVTIFGRNFSPTITNNYVLFNADSSDAFAATILEASTSQLIVKVPEAETGTVRVYTSGAVASGDISFTYPPEIDSVDPIEVVAGDEILIQGRNFDDVEQKNAVTIGGEMLTIQSAIPHSIKARIPLGGVSGEIKVVVNGMESEGGPFVIVIPAPLLRSIVPAEINATDTRTKITVTGVGFVKGLTLQLKRDGTSIPANPSVVSYTSLSFSLPRGITPGTYDVLINRSISGRQLISNALKLLVN